MIKITTLVENRTYKRDLLAEHGLSFLIETESKKILLDVGQTDAFLKNAQVLGINICDVDFLVLSHGHYDHTGGLEAFLKVNSTAIIYFKKELLIPKYNDDRFIGLKINFDLIKNRIIYVNEIIELDNGIFIFPEIPIVNELDTHFNHFNILIDGKMCSDDFSDEVFLAVEYCNKISVISSCSHRGISNILNKVISYFGLPINLVLGGYHIKQCDSNQFEFLVEYMHLIKPELLGVCHCTGVDKFAALVKYKSLNVFYNHTGKILTFNKY